jgi:choline dehydrogenase
MNIIYSIVITIMLVIILYLLDKKYKTTHIAENEYDYIIIGAGAAGSVIAARLAEDTKLKILILEVGHDNSYDSKDISKYDKELIKTPFYCKKTWKRYHNNPNNKKCNGLELSPLLSDFVTIKENNSRYYSYCRGNGAGGSVNHHAMVDGRGTPLVYDRIAKLVNDDIWLYKNILPYYKKMENYHVKSANLNIHGNKGWLQVTKNGKLNEELRTEIVNTLVNNFNIPFREDPADPSQVYGVYISEQHVNINGERSNSFIDLLTPIMKKQNNIKILYNSLVKNIIIKKINNELVAKGVCVYHKKYLTEVNVTGNEILDNCNVKIPDKSLPKETNYYARKEVIICAGAISTPQILMLSGIGPKDELQKINVPTIVDLPGVGKNLMDHIESVIIYELDPKKIMWGWQANYFKNNTDYKKLCSPEIIKSIEKFDNPKCNNSNGMGLIWDMATMSPANIYDPDTHTQFVSGFYFDSNLDFIKYPKGDNFHKLEHSKDTYMPSKTNVNDTEGIPNLKKEYYESELNPADPHVYLSLLTKGLFVKGLGSITLKNNDPRSEPIIEEALWKNNDGIRRNALKLMILRKFMEHPSMKKFAKDTNSYEICPGKNYDTIDKVETYIKNWQSFGHHMAGTAKMGTKDDNMAVVDSRLRVFGVKNLRVVDASIYPTPHLHSFNISRGVYLIAEIASDFIKKENY